MSAGAFAGGVPSGGRARNHRRPKRNPALQKQKSAEAKSLISYQDTPSNYHRSSNNINHHLVPPIHWEEPSTSSLVIGPSPFSTSDYRGPPDLLERLPVPHVIPLGAEFSPEQRDPRYHDCRRSGCERVRINVSGQYFETRVGMLNRHPTTLLGNPWKRQRFYDRSRDEIFLDRN